MNHTGPSYAVVIWDDAWSESVAQATEKDAKDAHKPTVYETRGWLLVDDTEGVTLFHERCLDKGDETYRGRTFIPRPLIKSVTKVILTIPRKPRHAKVHHSSEPAAD